jgi:hypothetical protein
MSNEPRKIKRVRLNSSPSNDVGFGKPPRSHQFQPGQSGNPKGRPKGSKNDATILNEIMSRKIPARQNGRQRTITVREAIYHRLAESSLKGDYKAATLLFNRQSALSSQHSPEDKDLHEDDQIVLTSFLKQFMPKGSDEEGEPS